MRSMSLEKSRAREAELLCEIDKLQADIRDELYKIGLPGKSILGEYFQEDRTSQRHFLLQRINFRGRLIFIQLPPGSSRGAPRRAQTSARSSARRWVAWTGCDILHSGASAQLQCFVKHF